MFSIFKDKLQSVQDNFTTSFRSLKVSDQVSRHVPEKSPVDLNAGADLLHKYQTEWQEMHKLAEDNATEAQKVDARISKINSEATNQWKTTAELIMQLSTLPKLCSKTEQIISQIESLQQLATEVEETLLELADTVEQKELQEQQLEKRFQLVLHSEKRQGQLDSMREKLLEEHRQKVIQYEKQFEKTQKERQETFGKAFEEDLENYKQTGSVPTLRTALTTGPSLEEVELDFDTEALDQMLEQ